MLIEKYKKALINGNKKYRLMNRNPFLYLAIPYYNAKDIEEQHLVQECLFEYKDHYYACDELVVYDYKNAENVPISMTKEKDGGTRVPVNKRKEIYKISSEMIDPMHTTPEMLRQTQNIKVKPSITLKKDDQYLIIVSNLNYFYESEERYVLAINATEGFPEMPFYRAHIDDPVWLSNCILTHNAVYPVTENREKSKIGDFKQFQKVPVEALKDYQVVGKIPDYQIDTFFKVYKSLLGFLLKINWNS